MLGLNDNMMAEICNVLKALLQFHRSAFHIIIAFGKLLHSHKDNRAKYYHGSTHGREVLFDTAPKICSLAHVNKVINQTVRHDLGADLIHARENINFRGVMYTNFVVYHVPVIVKNDIKGPRRSIRRYCRQFPQWKTTDRTIVSHFSRGNHDVHYRDGLCMFRALAIHQLGISKITENVMMLLMSRWRTYWVCMLNINNN